MSNQFEEYKCVYDETTEMSENGRYEIAIY